MRNWICLCLVCLIPNYLFGDCRGCCSGHGGVVCVDGVTRCGDGTPLTPTCQGKGCDACTSSGGGSGGGTGGGGSGGNGGSGGAAVPYFVGGETGLNRLRILPHVTQAGGDFTTALAITNGSSQGRPVTIEGFRGDGVSTGQETVFLSPGEQWRTFVGDVFGAGTAYLKVQAHEQVITSADYRAVGEGRAPASVSAKSAAPNWQLNAGDWELTWDGLAVVNMGSVATDVMIQQFEADGTLLHAEMVMPGLAPGAKELYVLSTDFSAVPGSYFEISADQYLSMIALRGDQASTFLWENSARPLRAFDHVQTEALTGMWDFSYVENGSRKTLRYALTTIGKTTTADGAIQIHGLDDFGGLVHAYFDTGENRWVLVDPESSFTRYLYFDLDGDNVSGCYYVGQDGDLTSGCIVLNGSRVSL